MIAAWRELYIDESLRAYHDPGANQQSNHQRYTA